MSARPARRRRATQLRRRTAIRSRRAPLRVAVVTGTRAEYGLFRSTLTALRASDGCELQLVATGMHLLKRFGHTLDDIRRDGYAIAARVAMQRGNGSPTDQATGLARGIAGMARFFERSRTERVVVLGDRIEALAGALAAVATGRTLIHIHGGDVAPGDFDDKLRGAITQLADLHLPATPAAARRLIAMGAPRDHVHVVGAPGLDDLFVLGAITRRRAQSARQPHDEAGRRSGVSTGPQGGGAKTGRRYTPRQSKAARSTPPSSAPDTTAAAPAALILQHAYGRSEAVEQRVMSELLRVVARRGLRRRIILPNTDRGHRGVLRAIAAHARESRAGDVEVHRSLPRAEFLRALVAADVLVGNSSCGIIEAPVAGTPSVNVGGRQRGREVGGPTVIHAAESFAALTAALERALCIRRSRSMYRRGPYGGGGAGARIAHWVLVTNGG